MKLTILTPADPPQQLGEILQSVQACDPDVWTLEHRLCYGGIGRALRDIRDGWIIVATTPIPHDRPRRLAQLVETYPHVAAVLFDDQQAAIWYWWANEYPLMGDYDPWIQDRYRMDPAAFLFPDAIRGMVWSSQ